MCSARNSQSESSRQTMSTKATLTAEDVSIGESDNNVPLATGPFERAWKRLSSALTPRQHDTGEDQIERGEHRTQTEGTTHVAEGSHEEGVEAGTTPPDGPPAGATESQQHSPFSSTAFNRLPQPVPVVDVFFGSWWFISALRTVTRPVVIYLSVSWILTWYADSFILSVAIAIFVFRWGLLKAGRSTVPVFGTPIPRTRQILWGLLRWIQKFWVSSRLRFLNGQNRSRQEIGTCHSQICLKGWWSTYQIMQDLVVYLFVDYAHVGVQTELYGGMATTEGVLGPHLRRR